jgi:hypothetical protein
MMQRNSFEPNMKQFTAYRYGTTHARNGVNQRIGRDRSDVERYTFFSPIDRFSP